MKHSKDDNYRGVQAMMKPGQERCFNFQGMPTWILITEIGTETVWGIVDMGDGTTAEISFDVTELIK